jgi:hypothetical protein
MIYVSYLMKCFVFCVNIGWIIIRRGKKFNYVVYNVLLKKVYIKKRKVMHLKAQSFGNFGGKVYIFCCKKFDN